MYMLICVFTEHFLEPGDSVQNSAPGLRIFCHNAKSKYLIHMWRTLIVINSIYLIIIIRRIFHENTGLNPDHCRIIQEIYI